MVSRIWFINIILAVCLVLMGMNALQVWTGEVPEQKMPVKTEKSPSPSGHIRPDQMKTAPESQYSVIAEKNLFDPERKEYLPEEKETSAVAENKSGERRPDVILHGVVLKKGYQKALVQMSERSSGKNGNRWVMRGDEIGSLKVSEIQRESILLTDGSENYEILLYDGKKHVNTASPVQKNDAPNIIHTNAEEKTENAKADPPKENKSEKDTVENPLPGEHAQKKNKIPGKEPGKKNDASPVFGPYGNKDENTSSPAPEKHNSNPVSEGGEKSVQKNEDGNTQKTQVMNPFLQMLQRNSANQ